MLTMLMEDLVTRPGDHKARVLGAFLGKRSSTICPDEYVAA
jgi:hypothetical protein